VHYPPRGVILEARTFVDAGADLIIGSHPHVIQGKERYKNALIFYSLGNFIFDARGVDLRDSVLLEISWNPGQTVAHRFHPLSINTRFQPQPAEAREKRKIMQIIDTSNRKIASVSSSTAPQEIEDDAVYTQYEAAYKKRKIKNIINHFIAVTEDFRVILIISKKMRGFIELMAARLRGAKTRW
jgi:poly-gamma-glutamate synthesis protein (capsule biosynthesis protein)